MVVRQVTEATSITAILEVASFAVEVEPSEAVGIVTTTRVEALPCFVLGAAD